MNFKPLFPILTAIFLFTACRQSYQIATIPVGYYKMTTGADSIKTSTKVFIEDFTDSLEITPSDNSTSTKTYLLPLPKETPIKIRANAFDADAFTVPFKIRPAESGIPVQLDANFHLAFYVGRRHDLYKLGYNKGANGKQYRYSQKTGIGYGVFFGFAAATMRPEFMKGAINYEYEGLTANAGIAGIFDVGSVNVGIAIGADKLLDKNRNNWIYQHQPWAGVLLGINLN